VHGHNLTACRSKGNPFKRIISPHHHNTNQEQYPSKTMASGSVLLLSREFHAFKKRPCSNWFQVYDLNEDKIHEWIVYVIGPPATLFEGGVYRGLLRFPEDYPMSPPSLQFTSDVFHPNVYRDGKVCISTLQVAPPDEVNPSVFWRPVLGVEQALLSVVSLLSDPNLDDPANPDAAAMMRDEPTAFKNKVHKTALLTRTHVPSDFEMPVVMGSSATGRGGNRLGSGSAKAHGRDGDDDEEEEDEYVYSDDEWDMNDPDNDVYSVGESDMGTSSSSLMSGRVALIRGTSSASTKSSKSRKKKDKEKKKEKDEEAKKKKKKATTRDKASKDRTSSTRTSSTRTSSTRTSSTSSSRSARRSSRRSSRSSKD
jgi:ubiquitin-protein ligase